MRNLIFLLLLISNLVIGLEGRDNSYNSDPSTKHYQSDGGGYEPPREAQSLPMISSKIKPPSRVPKQKKIELLDTYKKNGTLDILEERFDGNNFWPKNDLNENCVKLDFESYEFQSQSVSTNVQFLYLENFPLQHKTDLSVDQIRNDKFKYQITVNQSSQYNLMTAEIIANYYIYNYKKKIPLLEITTDECKEVRFIGFTISPSNAQFVSKEWYEIDKKEKVSLNIGGVAIEDFPEGVLGLNGFSSFDILEIVSSDSMTKFTIVCKEPECKQRAEKEILLDLSFEKNMYDKEMKEQAIEEEKRIKREAIWEEKRIKKEAIEWKKKKKLLMEQAIWEEKAEKLRQKEEQLSKVRDASLTDLDDEQKKLKIDDAKAQCKEIGYESGSKKFKECIVELL